MSEPDNDDEPKGAPEGASCAEHSDRTALVTCPRCGSHCCLSCWHSALKHCHACLLREPPAAPPWVDSERKRAFPTRLIATLVDALRPTASAPAFAGGRWQSAIWFAVFTTVPIGLLTGIIPFTHTMRFGPSWSVTLIGDAAPSATAIALDVAQAAALGLLMTAVKLALLAGPYLSLTAAYGKKTDASPPRQVLLYRAWLVPFSGHPGGLLALILWGSPLAPSDALILGAEVASLVPLMLLLWAMAATARISGVGPIASIVVVVVPFVVLAAGELLLMEMLTPLLPDPETIRQGLDAVTPAAPDAGAGG